MGHHGRQAKPLTDPSQQAAPSAAGHVTLARGESWRRPHYSPYLGIPPSKWQILDIGHYYLAEPVLVGLGGVDSAGLFCNSAGQPYDPQPGIVWTVEEYQKQQEIYEKLDRPFLPGLLKGSPACDSYLAEQQVTRKHLETRRYSRICLQGKASVLIAMTTIARHTATFR